MSHLQQGCQGCNGKEESFLTHKRINLGPDLIAYKTLLKTNDPIHRKAERINPQKKTWGKIFMTFGFGGSYTKNTGNQGRLIWTQCAQWAVSRE